MAISTLKLANKTYKREQKRKLKARKDKLIPIRKYELKLKRRAKERNYVNNLMGEIDV